MSASILCIDDDRRVLDALETGLAAGVSLIHCGDLEEAFEILVVEEPDLVVLETCLTQGNGLDFVERVRRDGMDAAGTLIVVVTAEGWTPGVHDRATQLDIAACLTKPVPPRELVACVEELLLRKAEPQTDPDEDSATQIGIGTGRLADVPFAELLDRVHRGGESGILIVGDSKERTGIQVRNGSPVAVSLPRREDIDDYLVRSGRITRAERDSALDSVSLGLASIEEVLVDAGLVDEDALDDALREQAEEAMFRLFELPKGRFRFEPGRQLKGIRSLDLARSPQDFIVRGVLAWAPPETVRQALSRYADLFAITGSPGATAQDIPFSDAQRDFVTGLVGDRCVGDFLDASEFEQRTLYAFAILGAIDLSPDPMIVLDDAVAPAPPPETTDVAHEDTLFDTTPPDPAGAEPVRDLAYEDDLFEQAAFEEDSFESEMVEALVQTAAAGEADPLVDFDSLMADSDLPGAPAGEPTPEADAVEPEQKAPRKTRPKKRKKRKKAKRAEARARTKSQDPATETSSEPVEPCAVEAPEPTEPAEPCAVEAPEPTEPAEHKEVAAPEPTEPAEAESGPKPSPSYKIAPLGSLAVDPEERAAIAARVQRRMDRRYNHLRNRKKPDDAPAQQIAATGQPHTTAAGALESESYFRKGRDLLQVKKFDQAVEAFGMCAHLDPSQGEYVAHLGYALYLSKPDDPVVRREALEDIARGIKLSPDRELAYVYLGRIFKVQDEVDKARKMFAHALKIRPHCREASRELRLMDMRDRKKTAGFLGRFRK